MNLPHGYAARPATWGDLEAVVQLFKACDLADVGFADPAREHLVDDWRTANFELERDARVVGDGEASVVGYVSVGGLNPSLSMEAFGRVHPDHRGRGLGKALVAWGEAHALECSPSVPVVRNPVPATDRAAAALLERSGYRPVRTFWHMTRDLRSGVEATPEVPGVILRAYEADRDLLPTYDALEEAFADHWDSEPFPFEQHEREMTESDPELVAVAEAVGEVAGVAYGGVVEGDGWLYVVGVRPPWRGRGIARALLLRIFGRLAALGVPSVTLNVDSDNTTGATRLYEGVGMRVRRAWSLHEKRFDR